MSSLPLDPKLFSVISFWGISIFCLLIGLKYVSSDTCENLLQKKSPAPAIVLCIIWILFLGLRPPVALLEIQWCMLILTG